jgi:hypothetical protein
MPIELPMHIVLQVHGVASVVGRGATPHESCSSFTLTSSQLVESVPRSHATPAASAARAPPGKKARD